MSDFEATISADRIAGHLCTLLVVGVFFMLDYTALLSFLLMLAPGFLLSYIVFRQAGLYERILLGYPLSMSLIILFNTLSLTGIGFSRGMVFPAYAASTIILAALLKSRIRRQGFDWEGREKNMSAALLVIVLVVVVSWGYAFKVLLLPKAHAIVYYSRIEATIQAIDKTNMMPLWSLFHEMGYPIYTFDSPLFYQQLAFQSIIDADGLTRTFNSYIVIMMAVLGMGFLIVSRKLGAGFKTGIACSLLFITGNHVVFETAVNGYIKMASGMIIFLALIATYLRDQRLENPLPLSFMAAVQMLYYPPFLVAGAIIIFFHQIGLRREGLKNILNSGELKRFLPPCLVFLAVVGYWLAPNILNQRYTSPTDFVLPTLDSIMQQHGFYFIKSMSGFRGAVDYRVTLLILAGIFLAARHAGKTGETVFFRYAVPGFIITSITVGPIPLLVNMVYYRAVNFTLFLLLCLWLSASMKTLLENRRQQAMTMLVLIMLVVGFQAFLSITVVKYGFEEGFTAGMGDKHIDFMREFKFGRILPWGIFQFAFDSYFTRHSLKPGFGGGFFQTHFNKFPTHVYESMDIANPDHDYIKNIYHRGFLKYFFVGDCKRKTGMVKPLIDVMNMTHIYSQGCVHLYGVPETLDSGFAEKTSIAQWSMDFTEFYHLPAAYKVTGLKDPRGPVIRTGEHLEDYPEPEPLEVAIHHPEKVSIESDFKSGQWILVKQHYFPRWRAWIGGKEVEVHETVNGMMAVEAADGRLLEMVNKPFTYEIILSLLSAAAIPLFFIKSYIKTKNA